MNPHRSERLVYTAFDAEKHDAFLFEMHNDPISWTNACSQIQVPMTRKFHQGVLHHHQSQLLFVIINRVVSKPSTQEGGVVDNASPAAEALEPIGKLVLELVDTTSYQHGNTELGMGIHKDFQGQGYGTEALNWVMDWAFNYANIHRLGLTVYEWNTVAYAVYKKVGFQEEGRKRESLYKTGRRWDEIIMGVLVHEWKVIRALDKAAT
ncbi:hypothetical protein NLG97_g2795 [Lecanicillium saksenae]|uniref:Uncharacterized protein n=1 Tax=Lecanicillium saksenae TaxID=468837 RepID=A0ACC1R1P5_9HYPO|nr:hypothetical protein NLG97_g2795 [Lecanicillium saksenae]